MSHQGSCSSEPAGDLAEVLTLDGAFDRSNTAQVELALSDAIDAAKPRLVIDLRGVSFLDSAMLRDAALAERAGYAALQVAVQRVAAREAWLTWPERRGQSR